MTHATMISIQPDTLIPDLLHAAPQTRPVLDRYGLRGCGGDLGPMETLDFFARAHEVPLDKLLHELREAASEQTQAEETPSTPETSLADTIYQPFFKAGIAVVLTMGAVWGAYLLLRIGFLHSFTAVSIHEVNAHGHAQIFGWVGLFVMGFAYQAFPRFKHTSLACPRLAWATLGMMLGGILLRSTLEPFVQAAPWLIVPAFAGSLLSIAAIGTFIGIIWKTLRGSGKPFAFYDYYILSALAWFFIQGVYSGGYFLATALAPTREALLDLVSVWQGPLRDIQIHGFIMLMILGVSQRMFHNFYGLPAPQPRKSLAALVGLNIGVVAEATGLVMMRTAGHAWATLWYGGILLIAACVGMLMLDWRIYSRAGETDRSLKFLRTAYAWLLISLAMLVLLPAYQFGLLNAVAPGSEAAQLGFSHAYYGAIRHAITVGFVSMMIAGVAAKVVPTLKGVNLHALTGLWVPFILINAGCAMRVGFQTLTDFTELAFPVAAVSGLLEVSALALWGVHLWRVMNGHVTGEEGVQPAVPHAPIDENGPIVADNLVGAVLERYPHLLHVFLDFGFTPLANPLLRKALANRITIAGAARKLGVDLEALLETLNAQRVATGVVQPTNAPDGQRSKALST